MSDTCPLPETPAGLILQWIDLPAGADAARRAFLAHQHRCGLAHASLPPAAKTDTAATAPEHLRP